jgi:hypothetical protein
MATATFVPIANVTLATAVPSITFGSISNQFADLVIIFQGLGSTTLQGRIRLNGDTSGNYLYQRMSGNGTAASAVGATAQTSGFISAIATATTTSRLNMEINIMGYSDTGKNAAILCAANSVSTGTEILYSRWITSTVNSVEILTSTGNWAIGTTAALYGIEA